MTTGLFATHPLAFGHELHIELGRTRAIMLALLATLFVALVAPSALRVDRCTGGDRCPTCFQCSLRSAWRRRGGPGHPVDRPRLAA